jgi:tetratricopeptide (TPR) repeat protein
MAEAKPGPRTQRNLAKGYKTLAEVQRANGDIRGALESARASLAMLDNLREADPRDKRLQIDVHMGLVLLIDLLLTDKQVAEAHKQTVRAVTFLQPLVEQAQPALHDLQDYVLLMVSTPFAEMRDGPAAVRHARRAVEMTGAKDPESLHLLARALALTREYKAATVAAREAVALLPATAPMRASLEKNAAAFEALALRPVPPPAKR